MYYISKRMEISACHRLNLSYPSKCENLHGHNWIFIVYCKAQQLNEDGMVVDFTHIKKEIHEYLDHSFLNEKLDFNPTAENMAKWVVDNVDKCYKCSIQESEGNIAIYEKDIQD